MSARLRMTFFAHTLRLRNFGGDYRRATLFKILGSCSKSDVTDLNR